jgi:hypothetical protein
MLALGGAQEAGTTARVTLDGSLGPERMKSTVRKRGRRPGGGEAAAVYPRRRCGSSRRARRAAALCKVGTRRALAGGGCRWTYAGIFYDRHGLPLVDLMAYYK